MSDEEFELNPMDKMPRPYNDKEREIKRNKNEDYGLVGKMCPHCQAIYNYPLWLVKELQEHNIKSKCKRCGKYYRYFKKDFKNE